MKDEQKMFDTIDSGFSKVISSRLLGEATYSGKSVNQIDKVSVDDCGGVCHDSCPAGCPAGEVGVLGVCADASVIAYSGGFYGGLAWT